MRGRPTAKQEAALVAWVNRQRSRKVSLRHKRPIQKLKPGQLHDSTSCVLANSIGGGAVVGPDYWRATPLAARRPLPGYVQQFIRRVEAGDYSDLNKGHTEAAA